MRGISACNLESSFLGIISRSKNRFKESLNATTVVSAACVTVLLPRVYTLVKYSRGRNDILPAELNHRFLSSDKRDTVLSWPSATNFSFTGNHVK